MYTYDYNTYMCIVLGLRIVDEGEAVELSVPLPGLPGELALEYICI